MGLVLAARLSYIPLSELCLLLTPAVQSLWQAGSEREWLLLYENWLSRWQDGAYKTGETFVILPNFELDERTMSWLEEADELGILLMSQGKSHLQGPCKRPFKLRDQSTLFNCWSDLKHGTACLYRPSKSARARNSRLSGSSLYLICDRLMLF